MAAAAVALGLGLWGYAAAHRNRLREEVPRVEIADLIARPGDYEGKTLSLVLEYDKRRPEDPVAEFISRSDCYLHDATGSILLFGGWQVWMEWRDSQPPAYASDWVDVDAAGHWTVKAAIVRYTAAGLPYLEPPEDAGGE